MTFYKCTLIKFELRLTSYKQNYLRLNINKIFAFFIDDVVFVYFSFVSVCIHRTFNKTQGVIEKHRDIRYLELKKEAGQEHHIVYPELKKTGGGGAASSGR